MENVGSVGVEPSVLRWARESIGLSIADVAIKLKRSVDDVESWEAGVRSPTYPQLEKLAYQIYKRPLAVFFLPEPPVEVSPNKEFRSLPEADLNELQPDSYLHIRKGHAYQLALKELFNNRNPVANKIWQTVPLSIDSSIVKKAEEIRNLLSIDIHSQMGWRDDDAALKIWRKSVERAGVFVFKAPFKQKEISGFCLEDSEFPLIYLNNSTTKSRQIFSLLHELIHVLLNTSDLSKFDSSYVDRLPEQQRKIERFCNSLAAEVLIPSEDFYKQITGFPYNIELLDEAELVRLANRYGVSREVILRRFLDQDRVSQKFYKEKTDYWNSQRKNKNGGDWYASTNAYLSERFATEVVSRHYKHQLTMDQAADLLGIKAKNFEGLEQRILQGAGV